MEVLPMNQQFNNNIGESEYLYFTEDESNEHLAIEALSRRLSHELKTVKKAHVAGGEVLLPPGLPRALARDVWALADAEPYGLRGCTIFLAFENIPLGAIDCDPSTAATFHLHLTLKQSTNGWNQFLPQFIKKMTRGGAMMISSDYDLKKKKLYRSYED